MLNRIDELEESIAFSRRTFVIGAFKVALLSTVSARLIYLGGIQSSHYQTLADGNRIKLQVTIPDRGQILDRNNRVFATNRWSYRLVMDPEGRMKFTDTMQAMRNIIDLSGVNIAELKGNLQQTPKYMPFIIKDNLSWDEVCKCELRLIDHPYLRIERGQTRYYENSVCSSHFIGYIQSPNEKDEVPQALSSAIDFKIGRIGLERVFDERLRGVAGFKEVEINAKRQVVRTISVKEGSAGKDLQTTIDLNSQKKAYELLEQHKSGVVIAIEVKTGKILTFASYPGFDNNLFTSGISHKDWNALNGNPYNPMLNRAIKGLYAPGSLFKMIVALAGLHNNRITATTQHFCSGYTELNGHRFHCHSRHGHGQVNLEKAIRESCDVYFFESCKSIGIELINNMAHNFGFGSKTGLSLAGEKEGLLPNKKWMREKNHRSWTLADTILTSIGQGALLATPIQLAVYISALANKGVLMEPLFLANQQPKIVRSVNIKDDYLSLILNGMYQVVNHDHGSAKNAWIKYGMAGKTATSQVRRISKKERESGVIRNENIEWKQRDHAMFAGFAPFNDPKYCCLALIEHGGSGSKAAAPIVKEIIEMLLDSDNRHMPKG